MFQLIVRFLDSLLILAGVVTAIIGFSGVLGGGDYRGWAALFLAIGILAVVIGVFIWRNKRSASNRTKPIT